MSFVLLSDVFMMNILTSLENTYCEVVTENVTVTKYNEWHVSVQ